MRALAGAALAHERACGDGIGDAIHVLMRVCMASLQERSSRQLDERGLSYAGYAAMLALYGLPGCRANPSALSALAGEMRSNMTRVCDGLVNRGWVRRVNSAQDRRRVELSLTEAGMALLDTVTPRLRQDFEHCIGQAMDHTERAAMAHLLARLAAVLDEPDLEADA